MARKENCCQSIILFSCPKLTIWSFIAIVSILEVIVYIISLCLYGLDNQKFLAPKLAAEKILGAADAKSTKNNYQFYRLIMPAFIHGSLEHISGNVAIQLYLGSGIENGIGPIRMAFLYLTSQIGGVILAMTVHPEWYGVGASCAGFGLIGFLAAYVITNWGYMNRTNRY